MVIMKEKDSLANTFSFKPHFSKESVQALSDYLKGRILRDRYIDKKYFSKNKKAS